MYDSTLALCRFSMFSCWIECAPASKDKDEVIDNDAIESLQVDTSDQNRFLAIAYVVGERHDLLSSSVRFYLYASARDRQTVEECRSASNDHLHLIDLGSIMVLQSKYKKAASNKWNKSVESFSRYIHVMGVCSFN